MSKIITIVLGLSKIYPVFDQPHISDPSILCAYTGENYAMGDWMFGAQVSPAQLSGGGVKVVVVLRLWWWWWWWGQFDIAEM